MENSNEKNLKNSKLRYYLIFFFIYSFLGWVLETLYAIYQTGDFVKRGFLFGPICPIYGYGALILIIFLKKYNKNSFKLFFLSAIIFSVWEYLVSFALDALFAAKWWDYTNDFFNLNGRISIFYSFVWGIFGILFINHIHPFIEKYTDKILNKIPYITQKILFNLIFIVYSVDTILSIVGYLI